MRYLKIIILILSAVYLINRNYKAYYEMRADKLKAETSSWRTSEQELFDNALYGGAVGTLLAMYDFPTGNKKHKISKASWRVGIPALIFNHLFIIFLIIFLLNKTKKRYFVFKDLETNEFVCFKYKKYKKNKIKIKGHPDKLLINNEFYIINSFDEIELTDEKIIKIKS